jgi:MFS family permease
LLFSPIQFDETNNYMNPWRGISRLPKEIWVLCGTTLINRMGSMGLPFLVVYLTNSQGYSATQAGLVFSIYGVAALVAAPFSGRLSDAIGSLRVMKLSLWLSGVVLILYPLARDFSVVIIATICWSVITEAFRPAALSIIVDVVEPDQRKVAFSANRLASNLGMSVGPALGGFLLLYSYPLIFWVDGATTLIAGLVLTLMMVRDPRQKKVSEMSRESRMYILRDRRLLFFVIALFPVIVTIFQIFCTLPYVCVHELGLASSIYGLFFTVNTVLIIVFEVPLNIAMSSWPHRHSMALGGFLIGAGFGGMMFASGFWSVVVTVVIWTFGEIILMPSSSAYVADIALPENRGMYMGVYQMTGNAALAFSGWFGMKILEVYNASILWGIAFLACSVSSFLLLRLREHKRQL